MPIPGRFVKPVFALLALLFPGRAIAAGEYTTFIGDANIYQVARIVTDAAGSTYVAGTRLLNQSSDVFVTELDAQGHTVFFRFLSGKGLDKAADLAVDAAGNVYIGGSTTSVSFPVHDAMQSTPGPGFIVKLSAGAGETVWSTYFREAVAALAVDAGGNVYVTGTTRDAQFPVTPGMPNGNFTDTVSISGAFITKISASGSGIVYSGVIAGSIENCGGGSTCVLRTRVTAGVSLAVDVNGNAYLAGNSETVDLPATFGPGVGAFVTKVKADGAGLVYLTYVGATQYLVLGVPVYLANVATAIACDHEGNAYVTGSTYDPRFPATAGALQTALASPGNPPYGNLPDAFALKLKPDGGVLWATYLGGSASDIANSLAVDAAHQVWLTGTTASPDFPNAQGWSQGSDFVTGLDASGSKLIYSARYPDGAASRGIAVDSAGLLHVAGPAGIVSTIAPGGAPVPRIFGVTSAAGGALDGRIAAWEVISIYGPHIGPVVGRPVFPDATGNLGTSAGGYQVTYNGQPLQLMYVSDSQINAVMPSLADPPGSFRVVRPDGTATAAFAVSVVTELPQIFQNADGSAVAINQDGTLNASGNAAPLGSYVSIWVTGIPIYFDYYVAPGKIATQTANYYCCGVETGLGEATVVYAGAAPGVIGAVLQVNFQIPLRQIFGPETISLAVVSAYGTVSSQVILYVR